MGLRGRTGCRPSALGLWDSGTLGLWGSRLPEHVRCVVGVRCRHSHTDLSRARHGRTEGSSGFRKSGVPNRSSGVQLADIVHRQDEATAADLRLDKFTSCPKTFPSECSADSSSCVTGSTDRILAVYLDKCRANTRRQGRKLVASSQSGDAARRLHLTPLTPDSSMRRQGKPKPL